MNVSPPLTRLGEVIKLEYGKPLPKEDRTDAGKYPAFGANGIKCRTDRFYHDRPSIVVGRKGSAGELALVEDKFWPLDVTYFVTFDESRYDLRFIYYLLKSCNLPKLAKGVKPGINRNDVYSIKAAFPSLQEQKRIAATLDEAFRSIDQAITNTEKSIENARALFDVYQERILGDSADARSRRIKERWEFPTLEELTTKISDGVHKKPTYVDQGIPFIKINNLTAGPGISFDDVSYISEQDHVEFCKRTNPERGDILITKDGTIGVVRVVETDIEFSIFVSVALIKPKDKQLTRYLVHVLESPLIQKQINPQGAALKHLYLRDLRKFEIPLPPKRLRENIVDKIDAFRLQVSELEALESRKHNLLLELRESILGRSLSSGQMDDTEMALTGVA